MPNSKKLILFNSAIMLSGRATIIIFSVITGIFLARSLGPDARGSLAVIILSINLLSIIFELGGPQAIIYLIGKEIYKENELFFSIFVTSVFFSFFSIAILFPLMTLLSSFELILQIAFCFGVATSISISYLRHALLAKEKFLSYSLNILIEVLIYLILILYLYFFDPLSFTRDNVVVSYSFAVAFALFICFFQLVKIVNLNQILKANFRLDIVLESFKRGFYLFIAGVSGFLQQRIIYFLLSQFLSAKSVGLYTIASTIPNLFANVPQQIATVLYANSSKSQTTLDNKINASILIFMLQAVSLLSVFFSIFIWPFSELIIVTIFGDEYAGVGSIFVILIFGAGAMGVVTLIFNTLAGIGLHKEFSYVSIGCTLLICLFSYLGISYLGLLGAAISQSIVSIIACLWGLRLFSHHYEVELVDLIKSPFYHWKVLKRGELK